MSPRLNFLKLSPAAYRAMASMEQYLSNCGLEKSLRELVKLRSSQINGCAYCIDMHWKDARAGGETEQRLYGLDAWAESPYYTDRERAALAWTEALTLITAGHAPDSVYEKLKPHFLEKEISDLTWLICTINSWNRIAIGLRSP